jgi:hypothetical protein
MKSACDYDSTYVVADQKSSRLNIEQCARESFCLPYVNPAHGCTNVSISWS